MDLSKLKYFHAAVASGSITAASKTLHVSQPSVSKAIRLLEEEYGVKLLNRGQKGVSLTAIGKEVAESCRNIFLEVDEIKNKTAGYKTVCRGTLPLGASDNLCNYVMPKLLAAFVKAYPDVNVKLFSGTSRDIQQELLNDHLEIGLFYTPVDNPALFDVWKIGVVPFVLVVPKGSPKAFSRRHFAEQLTYVGSRKEDYRRTYPALRMHQVLGLSPKRFIETNNQETQKKLTLQGLGYTIVPRHVVSEELLTGQLTEVQVPPGFKLESPVYLVKRRSRNLDQPAAVFREFLKRHNPFAK